MIADRVAAVRDRIARAAARAGRTSAEVTLVAVSKTHPPEAVREAFAAGVRDVGENRVQEAEGKVAALADLAPQGLRWHLVGHLQSNKARKAVALFDWVHSLDGAPIGRRLAEAAAAAGRELRALVQVELVPEPTKSGLDESQLFPALESLRGLGAVRLLGLMALPPYEEEAERTRPYFRRLRALRDRARQEGLIEGGELSMGMSHDLEVAVEEGATLVRVGTAIFGERSSPGG
ncbi:MAG TPA: YggS family pyridoxal phosphate-dependent enzyme [Vicinamibacteria bacterium]